jgi:lysozyme
VYRVRWLLLGLLAVVVVFTAACEPKESTTSSSGTTSSCTGSQTVTVHNGDTLTSLVQNNVSGTFATQQVVTIVADMNGISDRNVIVANQQVRLPSSCTTSTSTSSSTRSTSSSSGCTGSQTVTVHNGDTLTSIVESDVGGTYTTQQVVNVVADMNGITDRNVIITNQQVRLPTSCSGP